MTERIRQPTIWFASLGVGACFAFALSSASASDLYDYDPNIPNGPVNTCITCHTTLEGIDLNSFGLDVQNNKAGDAVPPDWAAICGLDSDVDGQTNGQELGDPCCEWSTGQPAPRTTDIANPGDDTDTSANPDAPGCAAADDDDGCSMVAGSTDGSAWLAGALVAVSLLWSRGRRRNRRG